MTRDRSELELDWLNYGNIYPRHISWLKLVCAPPHENPRPVLRRGRRPNGIYSSNLLSPQTILEFASMRRAKGRQTLSVSWNLVPAGFANFDRRMPNPGTPKTMYVFQIYIYFSTDVEYYWKTISLSKWKMNR